MTGPDPDSVLLEYTQDKVVVVDEDGEFVYLNAAAERILGFEPADLVGENAFDYIHPDMRERARETFGSVVAADEERTETLRYRHRTADGGWVWLESRFSNLTDSAVGGYVVVSRDVTGTVEAERERDETHRRLEELTGSVRDVLWMFTADWSELLFVNSAYEEVYGTSRERLEADPTSFIAAVHPDDVPLVEAAMARLSEGERVDVEYRVNPRQDYGVVVWVQAEPVVEDGEVVRVVGFSRDVTDRKRRERQLAVMDNMLRHNLRNDMTVMLGHAAFVAEKGGAEVAEHAEVIRREGVKLLESARKQRDIIELLTTPANPERHDLSTVLADAVAVARERHPGTTFSASVPEDVEVFALDELCVAVAELLDNGIRHDPDDPTTIEVTARTDGDTVVVEVVDDGPPIPEEEYRVLTGERTMDDVYHSTGLGLWLVYWVVDLSGGDVAFRRVPSGGNAVTLSLPRADGV